MKTGRVIENEKVKVKRQTQRKTKRGESDR